MGGVASKGLSCGERWEAEAGIQVKPEDTGFPLRSQDLEVKYHMVWETLDALKSVPYMEGVFEKSQSWGGRVGEWGVEKGSLICGLCNAFCIILHQAFHTITVNICPLVIHIFFFQTTSTYLYSELLEGRNYVSCLSISPIASRKPGEV